MVKHAALAGCLPVWIVVNYLMKVVAFRGMKYLLTKGRLRARYLSLESIQSGIDQFRSLATKLKQLRNTPLRQQKRLLQQEMIHHRHIDATCQQMKGTLKMHSIRLGTAGRDGRLKIVKARLTAVRICRIGANAYRLCFLTTR